MLGQLLCALPPLTPRYAIPPYRTLSLCVFPSYCTVVTCGSLESASTVSQRTEVQGFSVARTVEAGPRSNCCAGMPRRPAKSISITAIRSSSQLMYAHRKECYSRDDTPILRACELADDLAGVASSLLYWPAHCRAADGAFGWHFEVLKV